MFEKFIKVIKIFSILKIKKKIFCNIAFLINIQKYLNLNKIV